jgi:hypothetical protein
MFRPMTGIFSRGALLMLFALLAGCSEREPAIITPPKDVAAVVEPFLEKLRVGDKASAAKQVSSAATDELDRQFAADHKKLAATTKLTPRFITRKTTPSYGAGDEATLVYAARNKGKWTSATVRVYRYRDEPYKVEYWRVTNAAPTPALSSDMDPEKLKQSQQMMMWIFGALGIAALFGLILLIWLLKRKPHILVPEDVPETRASASTVQDA